MPGEADPAEPDRSRVVAAGRPHERHPARRRRVDGRHEVPERLARADVAGQGERRLAARDLAGRRSRPSWSGGSRSSPSRRSARSPPSRPSNPSAGTPRWARPRGRARPCCTRPGMRAVAGARSERSAFAGSSSRPFPHRPSARSRPPGSVAGTYHGRSADPPLLASRRARPRSRRGGPPHRPCPRRRVRGAVRRGAPGDLGAPGRRQDRGGHHRAGPRRRRPRRVRDLVRVRVLEPPGPRGAPARGRGGRRVGERRRAGLGRRPSDPRASRRASGARRRLLGPDRTQGRVGPRGRRDGSCARARDPAGERDVRGLGPAPADRDQRRTLGGGDPAAGPTLGVRGRRTRRHDPDRVPWAGGPGRRRVHRGQPTLRDRRGRRASRDHDARRGAGSRGRDGGGARAGDGRRALPRGRGASARGGHRGQGGERVPRQDRGAARRRHPERRRRRHRAERVGFVLLRRRGRAGAADGAVRGRRAPRVALRPAAGGEGRRALERERSPPVLRAPADPAHDEHLHPERLLHARGDPGRHRARRLRLGARRRSDEPRDRRLRVRMRRGVPDRAGRGDHAGPRREPDRQRDRGDVDVDAIAADFDIWPGICGKDGQGVPVGSGSPTLRISRITVGGTGA